MPRLEAVERRANIAGTQRSVRIALLFAIALAALYLAFAVYSRSAPVGSGPGVQQEFLLFDAIALALGAVGVVLTLSPSPRSVELTPDTVTVVGRFGRRRDWSPRSQVQVHLERRFGAGFLSRSPVVAVRLSAPDRPSRTYLVEEGLFSDDLAPR